MTRPQNTASESKRCQRKAIRIDALARPPMVRYFKLLTTISKDNADNDSTCSEERSSAFTSPEPEPYGQDEIDTDEQARNYLTVLQRLLDGIYPGYLNIDPVQRGFQSGIFLIESPDGSSRDGQEGYPSASARTSYNIQSFFSLASSMPDDLHKLYDALAQHIEADEQSHAAPPATEEALRNLERKYMNKTMLESEDIERNCTVCLQVLGEGQQAACLPCNHWFHEECVIIWLKEHGTCPNCRKSIEQASLSGKDENNGGTSGVNQPCGPSSGLSSDQSSHLGNTQPSPSDRSDNSSSFVRPSLDPPTCISQDTRPRSARLLRPSVENPSRLEGILRDIPSLQQDTLTEYDQNRATTSTSCHRPSQRPQNGAGKSSSEQSAINDGCASPPDRR
ncbi:hypothetical protein FSARC_5057 [Fusarium sarcochroum]|uniref:RING-type domain-containing protein n=1 Tax=Fusarium sarcochroum TaxID=1208366 RepID=A0A8H4U090_9HYPO|nr:hypothetical protein FSARC_5057 [Fusarium sarcochroum]